MSNTDIDIVASENDLLKKEASIRRSKFLSIALIIFVFFIMTVTQALSPDRQVGQYDDLRRFSNLIILLIALAYQYHLQGKHIESIKMYRRKLDNMQNATVE